MLVRIVRMYFTPDTSRHFLTIFRSNEDSIRKFPGCTHLALLRDASDENCFVTLSHWDSAADLEVYRKSELFESVWSRVKPLFGRQPQAFSLVREEPRL